MSKSPNGMIVFMKDQKFPGPVMLDIEITDKFPLITLSKETTLILPNGEREVLHGYDHVSIPPDFRLHLSGVTEHLFFDINPIWDLIKSSNVGAIHYFTVIGLPARFARDLVPPGKTRTWGPSLIISPLKDALYTGSTRVFVDFFLHNSDVSIEVLSKMPLAMNQMRLVGDRDGYIIGPHSYQSLQRKKTNGQDLLFTMRYGYIDLDDKEATYIYSPLSLFQRRARS